MTEAAAQVFQYDRVSQIESRIEFDVKDGKVALLEYGPASQRLRTHGSHIEIAFQIEDAYRGTRWAPILGFSLVSEDGLQELQVDFADLPNYEHLGMVVTAVSRQSRQEQTIAQVQVPRFGRRDVHEIEIVVESASMIAVLIDGKRRPINIGFFPHRFVARPSGVRGWLEFVEPGVS